MPDTRLGATPVSGGVRFRVQAPAARELRLLLHDGPAAGEHRMSRADVGVFELVVAGAHAGNRYSFRVDGGNPRPDPASRFQPEGVHGPSEIVDPDAYRWQHDTWSSPADRDIVIYELHVGTFTHAGTFAGAADRLGELRDLGVTVIELMPVADFAGARNWGYDGVALYAPSRAYGGPDDLRALVDRAHGLGLAVLLDVVYNHLGPEGAYLPLFNPRYLVHDQITPWGGAVNLGGPGSDLVRRYITDNATHWVREYRLDGLRLDATHALIDRREPPFLREFAAHVREAADRPIRIYAEDDRNAADIVSSPADGGWGFDGVWADDFHHVVRRLVAGDAHGYYADYEGVTTELARTIRQGWLYTGEQSRYQGGPRGTDPSRIPMHRFVICLQNHDQIGNRAHGDRLNQHVDAATWRSISVLLLTAPMTPLLFMGQEWAATTPFLYFTDLDQDLGRMVTEGRRREFQAFPEFADPDGRSSIPDPQAVGTFLASRLRRDERDEGGHAVTLALYRRLLQLRREHEALGASDALSADATALDADTIVMRRTCGTGPAFLIVVRLRGEGAIDLSGHAGESPRGWRVVLTTEDDAFTIDPRPLRIDSGTGAPVIRFPRPGAVILMR